MLILIWVLRNCNVRGLGRQGLIFGVIVEPDVCFGAMCMTRHPPSRTQIRHFKWHYT